MEGLSTFCATINTGLGTRGPGTQRPGTWDLGPGIWDPRTRDPGPEDLRTGDPGYKDPESWGLCCTVAVEVQLFRVLVPMLIDGNVLYMVAMHTDYIIYSRQHYFILLSDFFDPQSSLLAKLFHRVRVSRLFAFTFDPWNSVQITNFACSLACNKKDYSWICRVKNR